MGMYLSVRGWLELDMTQRSAIEGIIERHRHDLYSGGWAFPYQPFNWGLYVFYGGNIREGEVDWLRSQIEEAAQLPPVDEDGDRVRGWLLLTDERAAATEWHVRDGSVKALPSTLGWLGE